MNNPVGNLLQSVAFFTRLPIPQSMLAHSSSEDSLVDSVPFFPIAGFLIGLITGLVWVIAGLFFPPILSAGLAVASGIALTGALHEDGLADCADGLGGTSDRTRALEIMRDSQIGTYGTVALIFSIGIRWTTLSVLPPYEGMAALIIAHAVSRTSIVTAMHTSQYARPQGLGSMAQGELSPADLATSFGIAAVLSLVFGGLAAIPAVLTGLVLSWVFLQYLKYRLGGFTGDGLGSMQQIAEISIMLVLAGFWA